MSKIAVIYYSATGHVHKLAEALAKGAGEAGAEVRLRRVAELAPEAVIRQQDAWHEHYVATLGSVKEAKLEDLEWADGFALGTPTRYGLPAASSRSSSTRQARSGSGAISPTRWRPRSRARQTATEDRSRRCARLTTSSTTGAR